MSTAYYREKYTRADLDAMHDGDVVINLGCGTDERGIGIDINYTAEIQHNLNDGIPVAADSVDRIIAEHILEHLDNPTRILSECERILRNDGELQLEVPNAGWFPVRAWLSTDLHRFWRHKDPDAEGHWLARRLGDDRPERTKHKSLWTRALLEQYLDDAGFAYEIDGRHWSRTLTVTAWPDSEEGAAQTLHELERAAGDDLASDDYWAQTRATIMTRWIGEIGPDSVLDVGCGSGYLTAAIARADERRDVVGVDINPASIEVARQRDSPARFEEADAFDLPFDEFDCLVYGDVLEHFDDPVSVLDAGRDALADDGSVIVSVPAFDALYGPHDEHNGHAERYDRARLQEVADAAGFGVARTQHTNLVPLVPYFVYQRVLGRSVPDSARGSHGKFVSWVKRQLIRAETNNPLPVGVTLLAQLDIDA